MTEKTPQSIAALMADRPELAQLRDLPDTHQDIRVYVVGGAVRDVLLGRPVKDIDVVVGGMKATTLGAWLEQRGHVKRIKARFPVWQFTLDDAEPNTEPIDVALPRTETPTDESRGGYRDFNVTTEPNLPIEDDLKRRDFTINAMAYDIVNETLIDPFDGRTDLKKKCVRAVGNPADRFREDLTRILRAIRFAVQLNFDIAPNTWSALCNAAPKLNQKDASGMFVVPREMIGMELGKAIAADPTRTLTLLMEGGVLDVLVPAVADAVADNGTRISASLKRLDAPSMTVVCALLFAPADAPADTLLQQSGLDALPDDPETGIDKATYRWLVARLRDVPDPSALDAADFEEVFMTDRGHLLLTALQARGNDAVVVTARKREQQIRENTGVTDGPIPPLVTGDDVLKFVETGPRVGRWLKNVRSAQLKGEVKTKKDALDLIKRLMK